MPSYEQRGKKWRVKWWEDGIQRQQGGFHSRDEAEEWWAKRDARATLHGTPTQANLTFAAYATVWIEYCVREGLEPSTISRYISELTTYLGPRLGLLTIREIDVPTLKKAVDERRILPKYHRTGPNAKSPLKNQPSNVGDTADSGTRNKTATVLQAMMRDAVLLGYRVDNPGIHLRHKGTGAKRQDGIPTRQDYLALIAHLASRYADYIDIIRLTGLRPSELVALRWRHVDLDARRILVRASAPEPGGKREFKEYGKTSHAWREIRIFRQLLPILERLHEEAGDRAFDASGEADDSVDWVMTGKKGGYLRISTANTALKRGREKKLEAHPELADFNAYAHRHMFASTAIAAGVTANQLKSWMGHRSIQTTYDTYGHLFPRSEAFEGAKVEDFLDSDLWDDVETVIEIDESPVAEDDGP